MNSLALKNPPVPTFTRQAMALQLKDLGIREGDTLYVSADVKALGEMDNAFDVVVGALLDVLGRAGTVLAPAFNRIQNFLDPRPLVIDEKTPPAPGRLAELLLMHPSSIRSKHPSHSFVALGARANELLVDHLPDAPSFLPVKRLATLDGKMMVIGPKIGFPTVHVAQSELGLSRKHLVRHFLHAWIRKGESVTIWRPKEYPGCNASVDKFYQIYEDANNLIGAPLGATEAHLVPSTRLALIRDLEILRVQPTFVDCGRADCLSCGLRLYQPWRIPGTLIRAWFKREPSQPPQLGR